MNSWKVGLYTFIHIRWLCVCFFEFLSLLYFNVCISSSFLLFIYYCQVRSFSVLLDLFLKVNK